MIEVIKRDNSLQAFDRKRIINAILKANSELNS